MSSDCEPKFKNLNICVSAISFMASLTMTIFCFRNLRSNNACILLILGIACSDFIYSVVNMMSLVDQQSWAICCIEAITRLWSFNFSIFFVIGLSILCYRSITGRSPSQVKYFRNAILFGTIICLVLTLKLKWLSEYVCEEDRLVLLDFCQ